MPSDKRERQKARHAEKQEREAKEERKQRTIKFAWRAALVVVLVVAVGAILALLNNDSTDDTTTTTAAADTATTTTADGDTTTTADGATTTTTDGDTTTTTAAAGVPTNYEEFRAQPTACDAEAPPPLVEMTFPAPEDQGLDPDATITATIETSCGTIVLDLDAAAAPETVNSFVFLARQGFFDGSASHRIVDGFMIQAGDPTATGRGGPGYTIADEYPAEGFVYDRGVAAMANPGPGATGSQFFLMFAENPLPARFNPLGTVIEGLDVMDRLAQVPTAGLPDREPSTPLETVYIESVTIEVS